MLKSNGVKTQRQVTVTTPVPTKHIISVPAMTTTQRSVPAQVIVSYKEKVRSSSFRTWGKGSGRTCLMFKWRSLMMSPKLFKDHLFTPSSKIPILIWMSSNPLNISERLQLLWVLRLMWLCGWTSYCRQLKVLLTNSIVLDQSIGDSWLAYLELTVGPMEA